MDTKVRTSMKYCIEREMWCKPDIDCLYYTNLNYDQWAELWVHTISYLKILNISPKKNNKKKKSELKQTETKYTQMHAHTHTHMYMYKHTNPHQYTHTLMKSTITANKREKIRKETTHTK